MNILGIETSCDDTAIAIIDEHANVKSNVLSSQTQFYKDYGGIVPEIASRKHAELIGYVLEEALKLANVALEDIDLISVTYGPGLVGSLLVGVETAKSLSFAKKIPVIGVNHLEGHIYSLFVNNKPLSVENPPFPMLFLIVSGGHTELVLIKKHLQYEVLGETRDDAAGEALDKFARALGYGYPGGPVIQKLGENGDPNFYKFPRLSLKSPFEFSFSGLKTAGVYYLQSHPDEAKNRLNDICASFEEALTDILINRTLNAARKFDVKAIGVVGGVSANKRLREKFRKKSYVPVYFPEKGFSTDNAAMIAVAGYLHYKNGKRSDLLLDAVSTLPLGV
ncbi:MAG: tRNA (adenosine(37)-N6)-threonylcarbamoyltransferase complex transferase subunit TsaD [Caldisericaceae bacterium]|nr:tRNA (adenosine(37)-N6)-threonylcarbamoyltransferase complex transferase subunit TsaD [Caldisericaceae bacterium]